MTKAIGYGRLSQRRGDGPDESVSLTIQRMDAEAYCDNRGYDLVGWEQDDGKSGGSMKGRTGLAAVLDSLERTPAVLVVRDIARIGRNVELLSVLNKLMDAGKLVGIECTHGQTIGGGAQGKTMLGLMLVFSQSERDSASERQKRRAQFDRDAGKPHMGGSRPYGMMADKVTPVPAEVDVIRDGADRLMTGESLSSLAKHLRANGTPTSTGGAWSYQSLRVLYRSERLDADHLLGPKVGPAVRALLDARMASGKKGPRGAHVRWLSRCLVCGLCGSYLKAQTGRIMADGRRRPIYGCPTCMKISIGAVDVETTVTEFLLSVVVPTAPGPSGLADLYNERAEYTAAIARAETLFVSGKINESRFEALTVEPRDMIARVDESLAAVGAAEAIIGNLGETWTIMPAVKRQEVARTMIGDITVSRATLKVKGISVHDPHRLTPQRKQVALWYRGWLKTA